MIGVTPAPRFRVVLSGASSRGRVVGASPPALRGAAEEGIRDPRLSRSKCPGDLPAEALSSAGKVPSIGRWGGGVSRSDSRSCRSTPTQCLRGSRAPILAGAGGSRLAGFQSLIDSRPRSDFAVFEDALDESRRR